MRLLKSIKLAFLVIVIISHSFGDGDHAPFNHAGSYNYPLNDDVMIGQEGSIDSPNGGHGNYHSGSYNGIVSTDFATFMGGSGGVVVNSSFTPHGGSGLYINNTSLNITNTIFTGGSGGVNFTFEGYDFGEQGHGIEWNTDIGNASYLNLVSSSVTNGIEVNSFAGSQLNLSYTNTSIIGGIDKLGAGTLNIESRDENSLNDLDIKDGSVIFSDYLTIGSEEQITLSSQNSMLIASNGLNLAGNLSGSGSVEIYNDMTLSGALSGGLSINLSSASNSVTLQDGYNALDTTFNGNSLDDSLIIEDNGIYDAQTLGIGTTFQSFENIQLSSFDDIWECETNFNYLVDGGDGNDMFAFNLSTNYSINDFIQITNNIIGFESYGLSSGDDIWQAETNDNVIGSSINGRDGVDKISFENYRPESSEIGSLYQGFEGVLLEIETNTWVNTLDYSQLDFIEAPDTSSWTLSYSNNNIGITASAISNGVSSGYYRGFDKVELTSFDDTWNIIDSEENGLSLIDGGQGTNAIKVVSPGLLINSARIGSKYLNFDHIILSDSNDSWNVTDNDSSLSWIDAGLGVGYLNFGIESTTNNSFSIGDNRLYRNFDAVQLSGGNDIWLASTNDLSLGNIAGQSGTDTLSLVNYEAEVENFSKAWTEPRYSTFENVILTPNDNTWIYSGEDSIFNSVDGSGGNDILLVQNNLSWTLQDAIRYQDFETLKIQNSTLSFVSYNLGDDIGNLILENNSIVDLEDGSLSDLNIYSQNSGSILKMNVQTNLSSSARLEAVHLEFNPSSSVQFFGDTGSFAVGDRYTNYLGQASSSIDVNDDNLFDNNPGSIDVKSWFLENDGLYVIFDRRSLTNQLFGFSVPRGSQTEKILTEIDSLQTADASRMADLIFSDTFSLNDLNKVYSRTVALPRAMSHQRNGVLRAITERANERRISLSNFNKPIGVNGPIANQAGMSFWSKGYSANGTASADSNIEGYDLSGVGTIFGLDYAAKKYVAGIAAGMTSQTMKMDSSGEYTGSGTHFTGYMSYGVDGWFIESSASLANSSLDFVSAGAFDLKTNYSANDFTVYLGAGYLMKGETSSWIPEIGFVLNNYNQDNTQDVSQEIVATNLDDLAETSLQMRLGLTGGFKQDLVGRELLTQVKLRWLNTVGVSEEEIDFRLSGGSNVYQTPILNAAKSIVEFGVGTQLRMNRSFSLLMGFDYEVGGGYSANRLSAGVRYSF